MQTPKKEKCNHDHSHGHHHHHGHGHSHVHGRAGKNLLFAFLLNLGFAALELVGGLYTGSVAILADAVHDFGDSLTLGIAYFLEKLSQRKRTETFTYGYRRLSLLSSLIAGMVISVGSGIILYKAIPQFWSVEATAPNGPWMIVIAVFGLVINGAAAFRLGQGTSHNEIMLSWHLIEDVLGWAAVLVGAIVITYTGWTWVDPLLACGVALFILYNVSKNLWNTIKIFLQHKPENFNESELVARLQTVEGISEVRHIHVWSIDGESNVMSLHVVLKPSVTSEHDIAKLKSQIREIASEFGTYHTTIEFVWPSENEQKCEL